MLTLNKNRDDQKQELQTAQETGIEVDYLQYLPEQKLEHVEYKKYSLSDLSALGVVAEPVVTGIKNILNGDKGTSGIYYVNTKGKEMFKRKDGSGFTATLKGDNGGIDGQAVLNKMPCSPTTIVTAAALAGIEQKLGQIEEMQQEMMDYLKAKEKADLRGNINTLVDIMKNYKFNCDNEQYKMNKHILVQDIRRDAEQSIQLSRDQILKIMGRKKLISSAPEVRAKRDKVLDFFADYQMALYMYAFSSFLEVLLLGNYAADYLESVAGRIRELELSYRELYTDCYNTLENMSKKSVETYLAKGVAGVSKGAGKVIGKIPGIQKGPVDEALIASGEWIQDRNDDKAGHQLRSFAGIAEDYTVPFVNSVEELKQLYNQPQEIYVINDSLYLVTAAG